LQKEGTVAFSTSLYKIDHLIEEKQEEILTVKEDKTNE